MSGRTDTAMPVKADGCIDPDLQLLIDNAPPFDDDQRHGLRELLRPATGARSASVLARMPARAARSRPAEAA